MSGGYGIPASSGLPAPVWNDDVSRHGRDSQRDRSFPFATDGRLVSSPTQQGLPFENGIVRTISPKRLSSVFGLEVPLVEKLFPPAYYAGELPPGFSPPRNRIGLSFSVY